MPIFFSFLGCSENQEESPSKKIRLDMEGNNIRYNIYFLSLDIFFIFRICK